jgi:hypothetical protein
MRAHGELFKPAGLMATTTTTTPTAKETQELKVKINFPLSTLNNREQFF